MKALYLTLLLMLLPLSIHAEMYKWVDEEGIIQYTQTPPPEGTEATIVESVSIQTIPSAKTPASDAQETAADETSEDSKDALTASCQEAEKQLQLLQSEGELMMPDRDNPEQYKPLPPEIRQQKIAKTQEYIDNYCTQDTQP